MLPSAYSSANDHIAISVLLSRDFDAQHEKVAYKKVFDIRPFQKELFYCLRLRGLSDRRRRHRRETPDGYADEFNIQASGADIRISR